VAFWGWSLVDTPEIAASYAPDLKVVGAWVFEAATT